MKNRFSGDLGLVPLFFNKGTLTFSKKVFQKEKASRRRKESPKVEEVNLDAAVDETLRPPREVLISPDDEK